jgi:hypothetical protein
LKVDSIPPQPQEEIEQIQSADLVVAILSMQGASVKSKKVSILGGGIAGRALA